MRSLAFPKLSTWKMRDEKEEEIAGSTTPDLSFQSSSGSSISSPVTSTFSNRTHSRQASSSSSIATSPDSPANVTKSPLHDLVEDPAERDEVPYYVEQPDGAESICICDNIACEHRQLNTEPSSAVSPTSSEWHFGDDGGRDNFISARQLTKRRASDQLYEDGTTSRVHRRWPSITRRWRERKPTTSLSSPTVWSAPPSRSSSARQSSIRRSLASHLDTRQPVTPPVSPGIAQSQNSISNSFGPGSQNHVQPLEIKSPKPEPDPIDRQDMASTPLLPPLMTEPRSFCEHEIQSPLQSPSIAAPSVPPSLPSTPISSPAVTAITSPSLSAKPSFASIGIPRRGHTIHSTSDVSSLRRHDGEESDYWTNKLGHANFHIKPEPYLPEPCNLRSCTRLVEDWESARTEYMRHAARISEHYGPTSQTYKLTESKWAEIEAQWQSNLTEANARAEANGESPALQKLATMQPVPKMTSLNDPAHPEKFPTIDDADIVGPMVQYAKVERNPSTKKSGFLKLFTEPSSLLSRRATSASTK